MAACAREAACGPRVERFDRPLCLWDGPIFYPISQHFVLGYYQICYQSFVIFRSPDVGKSG
jgi:hypothetical protein